MKSPRLLLPLSALLATVVLAAVPLSASAASSGSSDKTFSKSGAPFSFSYPDAFRIAPYHGGKQLNKPVYEIALGVSAHDYLLVQAYTLKISVKPDGSALNPGGSPLTTSGVDRIIDATILQLTRDAGFTDQKRVTTGRLGSLRARIFRVAKPDGSLATRIYVALSGKTEYYLACQSSPKKTAQVTQGCDRLATSFAKRS